MENKDLILALRDAAKTCNTNAIMSLIAQVNPQELKNDKELDEAYRMALMLISD